MMKYVVLGFLTYGQFTGYDLRQMMSYSTSNFTNASFGSIYPALVKLEKDGLITSSKIVEKGRYKKIYSINKRGEEEFMRWLEEPIDFMRSYENILAKVFFYQKLPKENAIELIRRLIADINKKREELKQLKIIVKDQAEFFELSTLRFGIDHLEFMAQWYGKLIHDLSN